MQEGDVTNAFRDVHLASDHASTPSRQKYSTTASIMTPADPHAKRCLDRALDCLAEGFAHLSRADDRPHAGAFLGLGTDLFGLENARQAFIEALVAVGRSTHALVSVDYAVAKQHFRSRLSQCLARWVARSRLACAFVILRQLRQIDCARAVRTLGVSKFGRSRFKAAVVVARSMVDAI